MYLLHYETAVHFRRIPLIERKSVINSPRTKYCIVLTLNCVDYPFISAEGEVVYAEVLWFKGLKRLKVLNS